MKRIALIAVAVLVGMASCTKSGNEVTNPLVGKWLWLKSIGGVSGNNEILPKEGENRFLEFFRDSTYTATQTGPLPTTYTNRYSVGSVIDSSTKELKPAIVLFDETLRPTLHMIIIEADNEKLILKDNCVNCYTHYYRAVK